MYARPGLRTMGFVLLPANHQAEGHVDSLTPAHTSSRPFLLPPNPVEWAFHCHSRTVILFLSAHTHWALTEVDG